MAARTQSANYPSGVGVVAQGQWLHQDVRCKQRFLLGYKKTGRGCKMENLGANFTFTPPICTLPPPPLQILHSPPDLVQELSLTPQSPFVLLLCSSKYLSEWDFCENLYQSGRYSAHFKVPFSGLKKPDGCSAVAGWVHGGAGERWPGLDRNKEK